MPKKPIVAKTLYEESAEIQSKLASFTSETGAIANTSDRFGVVLTNKAMHVMPKVKASKMETDLIAKIGEQSINGVGVQISLENTGKEVSLDTLKFITYANMELARLNTYKEKDDSKIVNKFMFSTKAYAETLGLKANENGLKMLARRLRKVRDELKSLKFSWDIRDKKGFNLGFSSPIADMEATKTHIYIEYSSRFAYRLINGQICMFNKDFFQIKDPTEYRILTKMYDQYTMPANIENKRNDILKIKTLINVSSFQDYEELLAKGQRNWKARILTPLDKRLESLEQAGYLKEFYYCRAKGELFEEDFDIEKVKTYEEYVNLYVKFRFPNGTTPNH